jgi:hypothetical protein
MDNFLYPFCTILIAFGAGALVVTLSTRAEVDDHRFEGACQYLQGEVHDGLCIKDGTVVLTMKEFENG